MKKLIIVTLLLISTNASAYDWQHEQIMREGREAYERQQRWAETHRQQEQMNKLQAQIEEQAEMQQKYMRQQRDRIDSGNSFGCRQYGGAFCY